MAIVLDASVAIAWLFEDEMDAAALAVADAVTESGAIVPSLWRLEVANVLLGSERRGRCSQAFVEQSLERLSRLPITVADESSCPGWRETVVLARGQGLTMYDASYLELALQHGIPLATRDKALIAAADRLGIDVCGY